MDNETHARFQRMLLGLPEPEPQPQPELQQSEPQSQQHHKDANANLAPIPPVAAPPPAATPPTATPPPPLSSASKHLPAQPPSMVTIVQEQWLQLCDYFQRVQCANSSEERASLVRELGVVEDCLNTILGALLTDRKQLVSTQLLHTHLSILGESFHSELGTSTAAAASGGRADGATPSNSLPVTPSPSPASGFLLDGALASLPPCYRFLFADAHRDGPLPSGGSDVDDTENGSEHNNTANHNADKCAQPFSQPQQSQSAHASSDAHPAKATAKACDDDASPIGGIFLLTLCQYAKQDEPPGVRSIILEFLVRLLQEADLPIDRAAYPAGDPVLSLLQLNPPLLIVPLLDMLRKVSKALDPSSTVLKHGSTSMSPSLAYPWTGSSGGNEEQEDGTFLQDAGRTQFVIFLGSLAEKMERVPALANFFVVEDGAKGERNLFVLLDALLPYLTHDCSAPSWTHRRDTCRYALSAVVSLAKCPDPWIQDLVGKEARVATRTLMAARTTLLTLCKIPDNDDSTTQMLFLRDVLRFWATLMAMSPSVADDLRLAALVENEFYLQTLLPLLQSSDTHVYSAACLVTAHALRELNGSAPGLTRGLANALLATSIRKSSGRIIPHTNHYDSVVADDGAADKASPAAITLGQQEEAAAARLQVHPTTSFFLYYIVPHLSSNPYMSAEERENSALLGYSTTRWSTVKATVVLVQALAENVPEVFLREVFLMDMSSLADVLRKQRQGPSSTKASAGNSKNNNSDVGAPQSGDMRLRNLGLWSTAGAPPHLNVEDYYVKELHETTAASPALGLQAERVGEMVLTRLLRTEGNMSLDALRARQEVMGAMTAVTSKSEAAAASAASAETTDGGKGGAERSATPPARHAGAAPAEGNCWSHAGVQRSPLTTALCEMVQHLDATPFTVSSLVADLVVSLCVLPDLRVLYTLLDPASGPLKLALGQLQGVLQHKINAKGVEVTLTQSGKRNSGSGAVADTSLSSSSVAPVAAQPAKRHISLLVLYDTLLQHWDTFMDENGAVDAGQLLSVPQNGREGTPPRPELGAGFPVESLRGAIEANSNVLHACLYSEYLLAHLDAVVGYTALSQNLMYLQTSF